MDCLIFNAESSRALKYPKNAPVFEVSRDKSLEVVLTVSAGLLFVLMLFILAWIFLLRHSIQWTKSIIGAFLLCVCVLLCGIGSEDDEPSGVSRETIQVGVQREP
jgi:uncharacterized BrkB/YihY/UPF0761 family membrane protein